MEDWRVGVVVGVCAYELVAIATPLPTITSLCHTARQHPAGAMGVAAAVGWLLHHLLIEESCTSSA